jgi:GntR family transcriptional regulator
VVRIRRVHKNGDRAYMHEEVSLPERRFASLAEREQIPHRIADLAQEFGLVLGRGIESVAVAAAGEDVAKTLAVAKGTPVLKLDRVVFAIDGQPVEWRVATCHLEGERYVIEFA